MRSVARKSPPVASTGSPRSAASAYTAQSPKFNWARWPIPLPKRPNAAMAAFAWAASNGTISQPSSSTKLYRDGSDRAPTRARRTIPASSSETEHNSRVAELSMAARNTAAEGSPSVIATSADVSITTRPLSSGGCQIHRIQESRHLCESPELEVLRSSFGWLPPSANRSGEPAVREAALRANGLPLR
jgi:hypothetical protein